MATQIPCLVTRDLGVYLDAQDRAEAAFEAAEAEINRESPTDLACRIADFLAVHPSWGPEGWDDINTEELLAAVADDDLLWAEVVEREMRGGR